MKDFKLTKDWLKSFLLMLVSVILMGFSVSLLVLTKMGTDPCSSMNYGVSALLGMSFGNYQLLFNGVLLILVILCKPSLIGTGTLGNMIVVGYTADFFSWVWTHVCHIPADLSLTVRFGILIPALVVFVFAAACYMQSGRGMAPYDALPFILTEKLEKVTGKEGLFAIVRPLMDLTATIIGFATGGEVGIMTILMIITLGPTISWVGKLFQKKQQ